jgi:hypothetical protein
MNEGRPPTGKWLRTVVCCPRCGQRVAQSLLGAHRRSLRHRQAPLLRRLFADPAITFRSIARRFGVSNEMVRLLAHDMGYASGRARLHERERQRQEEQAWEWFQDLPVWGRRGFQVRGISAACGRGHYVLSQTVEINGWRCTLRHALRPPSLNRRYGPAWVCIRPARTFQPVDFVLYHLPPACPVEGWLVVPAQQVPRYSCNFPVQPRNQTGARAKYRGRWPAYLNAWQQLRRSGPVSTLGAEGGAR